MRIVIHEKSNLFRCKKIHIIFFAPNIINNMTEDTNNLI